MARVEVPVTDITSPKASLTTALAGANNDMVFTARTGGPGGNSIRLAYLVAGANTALSITVAGFDISVNVATDGASAASSTAAQVKAALEANSDAAALFSIAHSGSDTGAGIVVAFALTAFAGGLIGITPVTATDGDATNKNSFTGNDGQVYLECVSTDGSSRTVTFYYAPGLAPGVTVATSAETIAAGATKVFGPFAKRTYDQNSSGDIYFDPSVSTTLKFRCYRLTKVS